MHPFFIEKGNPAFSSDRKPAPAPIAAAKSDNS